MTGPRRTYNCEILIIGNIKFTDLNDPAYKPEENGGVDFTEGMKVRREGGWVGRWFWCVFGVCRVRLAF